MSAENNTIIMVKMLVLRTDVIERIKGRDDIKPLIANAIGLHRTSVWRIINQNIPNGPLTKTAVVNIICEKLSLDPSEILMEVEPCETVSK